jgi:hypothetical protein
VIERLEWLFARWAFQLDVGPLGQALIAKDMAAFRSGFGFVRANTNGALPIIKVQSGEKIVQSAREKIAHLYFSIVRVQRQLCDVIVV